jgi:hypothetical protein
MAQNEVPLKTHKKKKLHVGIILLVIVVLVLVVTAGLVFRVPQKIGLVKSPAERLLASTPDSEKAAAIMDDLEQAGLATRGVEVYVLPMSGTDDNLAIIVLDASKGFDINDFQGQDPVKDLLAAVSGAEKDGINRAAVAYFDEAGKPLVTATVPTDVVTAYTQGKLTDRQLMEKVDVGTDNLPALIGDIQEQLK